MAILTISRQLGSGGREIGYAIAESMGYDYIDKQKILDSISTSGKKWEEWSKYLDEHCPTVWEKYDWSFKGFVSLMQSHILNYALRDKVVILGRGGNFLLKGIPYVLRIRVTAPIEQRIERIMKRESVDYETATYLIKKTDSERDCFIYSIYGEKWDDPSGYDMLLDLGKQNIEESILIIKKALIELDKNCTEDARKILKMRAHVARIKAAIMTDPSYFVPTLDIYYDGNFIVAKGIIHSTKEHKRLEEEIKKLSGEIPVRCELHYRE